MTVPTLTSPPAAPSRLTDGKTAFVSKADAFAAWWVIFSGQLIIAVAWIADQVAAIVGYVASASASALAAASAAAAAASAAGYMDTCATSVSATTGAKNLTLDHTGKSFANAQRASLVRASDPTIRLSGLISSANSGAGTYTLTVDQLSPGAAGGPFTDWLFILDALLPPIAASVADMRVGTDVARFMTAGALASSQAFITLTDASTVSWNVANGPNARVTINGNRTIAAPTNMQDGLYYTLDVVQGTGGSFVPSYDSVFDFGVLVAPTHSTTAGKEDKVVGQYNASRGKLECGFRKAG